MKNKLIMNNIEKFSNSMKLIKEQYPMLKNWSDSHAYEIYKTIQSEQIIKEFLNTVDINKTVNTAKKRFSSNEIEVITHDQHKYKIFVGFKVSMSPPLLKKINDFFDSFGWFPAYIIYNNTGYKYSSIIDKLINHIGVIIQYEAKYDTPIKLKSRYIYHITPSIYYDKIRAIGLTPKGQGKLSNHPERIYCIDEYPDNIKNAWKRDNLLGLLYPLWATSNRLSDKMCVLKIDTQKLPNHNFFIDPNYKLKDGTGIYTYQNIPPNAIKLELTVKVNSLK